MDTEAIYRAVVGEGLCSSREILQICLKPFGYLVGAVIGRP